MNRLKEAKVVKHLADNPEARVLAWFSCGAASAVAAQLAVQAYGDRCEVCYCDTSSTEHPDNMRFLREVEAMIGKPIQILRSSRYRDTWDVFEKTGYLVGPKGARCTTELKKNVRRAYASFDDVHVLGFSLGEESRATRFVEQNPEVYVTFNLIDEHVTKAECFDVLREAGIALPVMYGLGFKNNNCIGCVKGGAGYWNKIRLHFPEVFARMAAVERSMDVTIISESLRVRGKTVRRRIFLDELDPSRGVHEEEPDIECGVMCIAATDGETA